MKLIILLTHFQFGYTDIVETESDAMKLRGGGSGFKLKMFDTDDSNLERLLNTIRSLAVLLNVKNHPKCSISQKSKYVTNNKDTRGHYMADIYDVGSSQWYQTSDDERPLPINKPADNGYIIICRRIK